MIEIAETAPVSVEKRALSACLLVALAVVGGSIQLLWMGFLLWIVLHVPLSIVARSIF
jgi:hypothetical protein